MGSFADCDSMAAHRPTILQSGFCYAPMHSLPDEGCHLAPSPTWDAQEGVSCHRNNQEHSPSPHRLSRHPEVLRPQFPSLPPFARSTEGTPEARTSHTFEKGMTVGYNGIENIHRCFATHSQEKQDLTAAATAFKRIWKQWDSFRQQLKEQYSHLSVEKRKQAIQHYRVLRATFEGQRELLETKKLRFSQTQAITQQTLLSHYFHELDHEDSERVILWNILQRQREELEWCKVHRNRQVLIHEMLATDLFADRQESCPSSSLAETRSASEDCGFLHELSVGSLGLVGANDLLDATKPLGDEEPKSMKKNLASVPYLYYRHQHPHMYNANHHSTALKASCNKSSLFCGSTSSTGKQNCTSPSDICEAALIAAEESQAVLREKEEAFVNTLKIFLQRQRVWKNTSHPSKTRITSVGSPCFTEGLSPNPCGKAVSEASCPSHAALRSQTKDNNGVGVQRCDVSSHCLRAPHATNPVFKCSDSCRDTDTSKHRCCVISALPPTLPIELEQELQKVEVEQEHFRLSRRKQVVASLLEICQEISMFSRNPNSTKIAELANACSKISATGLSSSSKRPFEEASNHHSETAHNAANQSREHANALAFCSSTAKTSSTEFESATVDDCHPSSIANALQRLPVKGSECCCQVPKDDRTNGIAGSHNENALSHTESWYTPLSLHTDLQKKAYISSAERTRCVRQSLASTDNDTTCGSPGHYDASPLAESWFIHESKQPCTTKGAQNVPQSSLAEFGDSGCPESYASSPQSINQQNDSTPLINKSNQKTSASSGDQVNITLSWTPSVTDASASSSVSSRCLVRCSSPTSTETHLSRTRQSDAIFSVADEELRICQAILQAPPLHLSLQPPAQQQALETTNDTTLQDDLIRSFCEISKVLPVRDAALAEGDPMNALSNIHLLPEATFSSDVTSFVSQFNSAAGKSHLSSPTSTSVGSLSPENRPSYCALEAKEGVTSSNDAAYCSTTATTSSVAFPEESPPSNGSSRMGDGLSFSSLLESPVKQIKELIVDDSRKVPNEPRRRGFLVRARPMRAQFSPELVSTVVSPGEPGQITAQDDVNSAPSHKMRRVESTMEERSDASYTPDVRHSSYPRNKVPHSSNLSSEQEGVLMAREIGKSAILQVVHEAFCSLKGFFTMKTRLYQTQLKFLLPEPHIASQRYVAYLPVTMPQIPTSAVEEEILVRLRSVDDGALHGGHESARLRGKRKGAHKTLRAAVASSVTGSTEPLIVNGASPTVLDGFLTSVVNKVIFLLVIQEETWCIHAPARDQLAEYLLDFVWPARVSLQNMHRRYFASFVEARVRHFRDSVARHFRERAKHQRTVGGVSSA